MARFPPPWLDFGGQRHLQLSWVWPTNRLKIGKPWPTKRERKFFGKSRSVFRKDFLK
jgi:hypothetical protein